MSQGKGTESSSILEHRSDAKLPLYPRKDIQFASEIVVVIKWTEEYLRIDLLRVHVYELCGSEKASFNLVTHKYTI